MLRPRLWLAVISLHIVFFYFIGHGISWNQKPVHKRLQVRTIATSTPPAKSMQASQKTSPTPSQASASKPQIKNSKAPPVASKKAAPPTNKTKPVKKSTPQIPQHLLKELENNLAKIDEKKKLPPSPRQPSLIPTLTIDSIDDIASDQAEYEETIIRYLQHLLQLPEYGEVKMELTVKSDGSISRIKVLKTESMKNKNYLEKNLPLLKLPVLGSEKTFTLTFCNEI